VILVLLLTIRNDAAWADGLRLDTVLATTVR
jgi:hypothetical protein